MTFVLAVEADGGQRLYAHYPWLLLASTAPWALYAIATGTWPRWHAPGPTRVARPRRVQLREAFTTAEKWALALGWFLTGAAGVIGLSYVPVGAAWYLTWVGVLSLAPLAWWSVARAAMARPSAAATALDLGWDDMLRFARTRWGAGVMALGPVWLVLALDGQALASVHPGRVSATLASNGLLIGDVVGSVVFLASALVFRHGRDLWRRQWERPGPQQPPWPSGPAGRAWSPTTVD
jgi:hypothetical protein